MGNYFSETVAKRGLGSPYEALIQQTAAAQGIPAGLIKAIISAESAWKPTAHSSSSHGLMQLNAAYWIPPGGTLDSLYDPTYNITTGSTIIAQQLRKRGGDLPLAIAAYNAGTGRTNAQLAQWIAADTNGVGGYVATVLSYYRWFLANDSGGTIAPTPYVGAAPDGTTRDVPASLDAAALAGGIGLTILAAVLLLTLTR